VDKRGEVWEREEFVDKKEEEEKVERNEEE
jgi:hypothetical protein